MKLYHPKLRDAKVNAPHGEINIDKEGMCEVPDEAGEALMGIGYCNPANKPIPARSVKYIDGKLIKSRNVVLGVPESISDEMFVKMQKMFEMMLAEMVADKNLDAHLDEKLRPAPLMTPKAQEPVAAPEPVKAPEVVKGLADVDEEISDKTSKAPVKNFPKKK